MILLLLLITLIIIYLVPTVEHFGTSGLLGYMRTFYSNTILGFRIMLGLQKGGRRRVGGNRSRRRRRFRLPGMKNYPKLPGSPAGDGTDGSAGLTLGQKQYSGKTIYVTDLSNDAKNSKTFAGIILNLEEKKNKERVIVKFKVSGAIILDDNNKINVSNIVIDGEGKITFFGKGLVLGGSNIVLRNLRILVNFDLYTEDDLNLGDGLTIGKSKEPHENVIIENVSIYWSIDELISVKNTHNVVIRNCIFAEALSDTGHKSEHSFGFLPSLEGTELVILRDNIFAIARTRLPKISGGGQIHFVNNLIYNWKGNKPAYSSDSTNKGEFNFIGNFYKGGPMSESDTTHVAMMSKSIVGYFKDNKATPEKFKVDGEYTAAKKMISMGGSYFKSYGGNIKPVDQVYSHVLKNSGCFPRDKNDERLIKKIKSGDGKQLVDRLDEIWPGKKIPFYE